MTLSVTQSAQETMDLLNQALDLDVSDQAARAAIADLYLESGDVDWSEALQLMVKRNWYPTESRHSGSRSLTKIVYWWDGELVRDNPNSFLPQFFYHLLSNLLLRRDKDRTRAGVAEFCGYDSRRQAEEDFITVYRELGQSKRRSLWREQS